VRGKREYTRAHDPTQANGLKAGAAYKAQAWAKALTMDGFRAWGSGRSASLTPRAAGWPSRIAARAGSV
jgi:hypothetical protein